MSSVKDQILCLIWGRLPLLIFAKVTYLQNFFKAKLTWRSLGSSFERNVTGTKRAHLGLTWCILYTWLARYTWWQKRGGSFSCEAFQPAPDGCLPGGGDSAPGCHHLSTAAKRCFLVQSVQLCHVFVVVSSHQQGKSWKWIVGDRLWAIVTVFDPFSLPTFPRSDHSDFV